MKSKVGPFQPDAERRITFFSFRLATAIFGVVAVGATSQLFLAKVDICGGSSGWWIGAVFISPLIFVGMCAGCATTSKSEAGKSTWVTVAALLMLLYFYGAAATIISAGVLTTWC